MRRWVYDFFNLLYPELCIGCETPLSTGEHLLCTSCSASVPLTNFHKTSDEKMRELFFARINVEHLACLFYYEKIGAVQHIMHELKYRGKEEISTYLGKWLAAELKNQENFKEIDMVIPVPVHPKRRAKRGYNQVSKFGKELAMICEARFCESALIKTKNTINQAKLNQTKRSDETQTPYHLAETIPEGSHVLLVDDVVTTGTTLVLCARELQKIPEVKISIATMAISI
ncbi:ComF family protein [Nonlabens sp.]|uniref:ComF family protein n=1 Tax=Nonlabens sp. TaxID=1888209 RepID=UPI003F6998F4